MELGSRLLRDPRLLDTLVNLASANGHVGEHANKRILLLIAVSTRLGQGIGVTLKGCSALGKTHLMNTIRLAVPRSWTMYFSRLTPTALYYLRDANLSHKLVCVAELEGMQGAEYPLRLVLSEGELRGLAPVRGVDRRLTAQEMVVPAEGTAIVTTTTQLAIDDQMATRALELVVDDSEQQTRRVLVAQAQERNMDDITAKRRLVQATLSQLECLPVTVPFAEALARQFPAQRVRARRDFPHLLQLVRASALLYQKQRPRKNGKIVATADDYELVREVAENVVSRTMSQLSPQEEQVVEAVRSFNGGEFPLHALYGRLDISYKRLVNILRTLKDRGVVEWNGQSGHKSRYRLAEDPTRHFRLPPLLDIICASQMADMAEHASALATAQSHDQGGQQHIANVYQQCDGSPPRPHRPHEDDEYMSEAPGGQGVDVEEDEFPLGWI